MLTGIIPIACCPEDVEGPYKLGLKRVIPLSTDLLLLPEDDTYTGDTLILSMEFTYSLAGHSTAFSFQPAAMALSCGDGLYLTELQDKVVSISVTSNQPFGSIQAGEELNDLMVTFDDSYDNPITLEQAVSRINVLTGSELIANRELKDLAVTQKPADALERIFTVAITFESGKQEVVESAPIIW